MVSLGSSVCVIFALFSLVHGAPTPKDRGGCFVNNADYPGNDINLDTVELQTHKIKSAEDCQDRCRETQGCEFFTYSSSNFRCYLKSAKSRESYENGAISGPKRCKGDPVIPEANALVIPDIGTTANPVAEAQANIGTTVNPVAEAQVNPDGVSQKEFRDMFNEADQNGNYKLSSSDVRGLIRNQLAAVGQAGLMTEDQIGLVVDSYMIVADTTGDGELSFDEYIKVNMKGANQKQTVFDKFDTNGDGQLSSSELIQANISLQGPGNYYFAVQMKIRQFDRNGDGKLNLQEFSAMS